MQSELLHQRGLSLERLDAFCQIVQLGGLSQAADGNTSKVAQLSRQVKELEQFFGVKLMNRTGRGMEATESGKELYRIIRHDLRLLEDFRAKCAGQPAVVRIVASDAVAHWVIAPQLAALAQRLPGISFDVVSMRTTERLASVRNHESDFAIIRRETVSSQLTGRSLFKLGFKLVAPRALLRSINTRDPLQLMQKLPLALPADGELRVQLDESLRKQKAAANLVVSVRSLTVAARAVQGGQMATILPDIASPDFPEKDYALLPLPFLNHFTPHLYLAWNPAFISVSNAAAQTRPALLELLRDR